MGWLTKPTDLDIVRSFIEREQYSRSTAGLPASSSYMRDGEDAMRALQRVQHKLEMLGRRLEAKRK